MANYLGEHAVVIDGSLAGLMTTRCSPIILSQLKDRTH